MRNLKSRTEIRDGLIRLLAEENLNVVRHAQPAAFFDLKTRTVNVPNWDFEKINASDAGTVMDVHEVLHAIYTPDTHTVNATRNILEDIRIERLGKQKFPGTRQIFIEGYRQLFSVLDFFKLKDASMKKLNSMNFLDRLNLHAKVGFLLPLPLNFSQEEKVLLDLAFKTETFDDVLALEIQIKKLMKEQQEESKNENQEFTAKTVQEQAPDSDIPEDSVESQSEESDENSDEEGESTSGKDKTEEGEEDKDVRETMKGAGLDHDEDLPEPKSETIDAFDSAVNNILSQAVPNQLFVGSMTKNYIAKMNIPSIKTVISSYVGSHPADYVPAKMIIANFDRVIGNANRSALVLYKEFMMRKNAKERQFDTVKNTGKIDTRRIHLSSITDNIFRQKTTMFKGENHGFVFLIDVSGSMAGPCIDATLQQLFIVTEFCRKLSIKFKVYTFSTGSNGVNNDVLVKDPIPEFDSGNVITSACSSTASMIFHAGVREVLNSQLSAADYKSACRGLYIMLTARYLFRNQVLDQVVYQGTSTCSALFTIEADAKKFFDEHKIEKRNLILMTDGGAGDDLFLMDAPNKYEMERKSHNCIITDLKTKKTYRTITNSDKSDIVLNMVGNRIGAKTSLMQLATSVKAAMNSSRIVRKHALNSVNTKFDYHAAVSQYQPLFGRQKFIKFSNNKNIDSLYIIKMAKTDNNEDFESAFEEADLSTKTASQIASKLVSSNKLEKASRVLMQSLAESFN